MLVGNSFPLTLIRRRVTVAPRRLEEFRNAASCSDTQLHSYWGHRNTLAAAEELLGIDVAPAGNRPILRLTEDNLPMLDGVAFWQCWVLSPDYRPGYRPAIGEEVDAADILGWQILRIDWEESSA